MTYPDFLVQSEYLLRIFIACICGGAIGYERENRNKVAGIRTHAIVSLGSALIVIISKYGFNDVANYDAARVAAQIVSGIGFLGAGIIFVKNNSISGLTTAAGVWATSGIGMAIGAGLYYLGVASTLLILVAQFIMHKGFFRGKEHKYETVEFVLKEGLTSREVLEKLPSFHIEIDSVSSKKRENGETRVELLLIVPREYDKVKLLEAIESSEGVSSVKL